NAVAPLQAGAGSVDERPCPGPVEVEPSPLAYRSDFLDEGARAPVECFDYGLVGNPAAGRVSAAFQALAGGRYRVWIVGDGLSRPLQTIVQAQGVEAQLSTA